MIIYLSGFLVAFIALLIAYLVKQGDVRYDRHRNAIMTTTILFLSTLSWALILWMLVSLLLAFISTKKEKETNDPI